MLRTGGIALLLALLVSLLLSASAQGTAEVSTYIHSDGSGAMIANGDGNMPSRTWSWQVCAPGGSACLPFATGQGVGTAGAPAPAEFVATSSDGETARSTVWQGPVGPLTAPTVTGAVRANSLVTPTPSTWIGGWPGDYDELQLAACIGPDGTRCEGISGGESSSGCSKGAVVIDPYFTGDYLGITDRRYAKDTAFPDSEESPPGQLPTFGGSLGDSVPGLDVASVAVVGKIAPATGPRESACGTATIPLLALHNLRAIALQTARREGERRPRHVRAALGEREKAAEIVKSSATYELSLADPERSVYLVAMSGHFVSLEHTARGHRRRHGQTLELMVDAYTGDVGPVTIVRHAARLSRLGSVKALP